jgi:hypothetical protein
MMFNLVNQFKTDICIQRFFFRELVILQEIIVPKILEIDYFADKIGFLLRRRRNWGCREVHKLRLENGRLN